MKKNNVNRYYLYRYLPKKLKRKTLRNLSRLFVIARIFIRIPNSSY